VNKTKREFKPRINACKDKEGIVLSRKQEILNRWADHYEELLRGPEEETVNIGLTSAEGLQRTEPPPTQEEIRYAITKLKNNKSAGSDGLSAELFKSGGNERPYRKHLGEKAKRTT
jgi:hypothetical protein